MIEFFKTYLAMRLVMWACLLLPTSAPGRMEAAAAGFKIARTLLKAQGGSPKEDLPGVDPVALRCAMRRQGYDI